jgi:hypothetical protein
MVNKIVKWGENEADCPMACQLSDILDMRALFGAFSLSDDRY